MENDTEQEFKERLALLNAINHEYLQWQWTTAKKDHTDQFGDAIHIGEQYLKRSSGPAYSDVIKMSRRSMERFLDALFTFNGVGTALCEHLAGKAQERHEDNMRKAVAALEAHSARRTS